MHWKCIGMGELVRYWNILSCLKFSFVSNMFPSCSDESLLNTTEFFIPWEMPLSPIICDCQALNIYPRMVAETISAKPTFAGNFAGASWEVCASIFAACKGLAVWSISVEGHKKTLAASQLNHRFFHMNRLLAGHAPAVPRLCPLEGRCHQLCHRRFVMDRWSRLTHYILWVSDSVWIDISHVINKGFGYVAVSQNTGPLKQSNSNRLWLCNHNLEVRILRKRVCLMLPSS